ncbi:uncharacterized protein [Musca autumnalis]|uniref:uncharacterized protein n=1 Tax=Musca autumnalis TaxID=221902 RepID=UPI003CEEEF3C
MVRENLVAQLKLAGIDFPNTATVAQLRELLKEVVGANTSAGASSSLPPPQQQVENVEIQQQTSSAAETTAQQQEDIRVHTPLQLPVSTSSPKTSTTTKEMASKEGLANRQTVEMVTDKQLRW